MRLVRDTDHTCVDLAVQHTLRLAEIFKRLCVDVPSVGSDERRTQSKRYIKEVLSCRVLICDKPVKIVDTQFDLSLNSLRADE